MPTDRPSPGRRTPVPPGLKAKKPGIGPMNGTNASSLLKNERGPFNPPKGMYDYTGSKKGGLWKNRNGTTVGRSITEDGEIEAYKSTGDTGAVSKYIAQRKAAGTRGY